MLTKDFSEFIALLNKQAVEDLVIGDYAVAFHGHPRYTKDTARFFFSLQSQLSFRDETTGIRLITTAPRVSSQVA